MLLLVIIVITSCSSTKKQKERPNIIFILTDDQRLDALGYVGNNIIQTPEMDQLASTGTFFKNAMVTTPICTASRASIFTGLYERSHRFDFQSDMKEVYMEDSYPKLLKESGYYTGFYGKFGVSYDQYSKLFHNYEIYDRETYGDRRSYFYKTIDRDTVHLTRYTGQQGLDFIENAPEDQPFCLQLSFSAPHAADETEKQYFFQDEVKSLYLDIEIPGPNISDDQYFNNLPEEVRNGFNRLRWKWRYDTPEKYQQSVKGYYRMISGIDKEIGKIRKKLQEKEIADNTVIIFMGDNGYFIGERQLAGKWLMYDNSLQVPLIIFDPRESRHQDLSEMALNIDVPATIVDMAGVKQPDSWHGKSLYPVVKGSIASLNRDTILIEHLWEFDDIPPSEGVRTKKWKYFRYVNDKTIEELYNLEADPLEVNNLAGIPKQQERLNKFRKKCNQLSEAFSDSLSKGPVNLRFSKKRFEWEVPSSAIAQKGYQVLVSSSIENCNNNIGDLWDSSHKYSDKHVGIEYQGSKLSNGQTIYWKVRIWDVDNCLTRYSKTMKKRVAYYP